MVKTSKLRGEGVYWLIKNLKYGLKKSPRGKTEAPGNRWAKEAGAIIFEC
jgi:hypothetical protein